MATSYKKTRKVDRSWQGAQKTAAPGLLRFYPAGRPARMDFYQLSSGESSLGRSEDCRIRLDDDEVSWNHAVIFGEGDRWFVEDRHSANGLFVDGQRRQQAQLHGGEVLRLGCSLLRFVLEGPWAADRSFAVRHESMVAGPSMDSVLGVLSRAAGSDMSVLISGETGTGKELAARHLHRTSGRSGPFLPVNCGAITATLFESEMFGHRKGAFTGATRDNPGHFRQAHGGTLLLDEIGELPLPEQPKLLRVLQDRRVLPVGGGSTTPVDVRVVCATNRELGPMVEQGGFRLDLLARISELVVQLPTLEQRREDIPALVEHFLDKHAAPAQQVPVEALEWLCCSGWPRNVRQLESAVRRALLLAGRRRLTLEHFRDPAGGPGEVECGSRQATDEPLPAQRLREALTSAAGDVAQVAKQLDLSVSQVYRRAKKYGLRPAHFRS